MGALAVSALGGVGSAAKEWKEDKDSGGGKEGGGLKGKVKKVLKGIASPDSYKRGGTVKRTGMAKVHKGERVLTKRQAKRYRKGGCKK